MFLIKRVQSSNGGIKFTVHSGLMTEVFDPQHKYNNVTKFPLISFAHQNDVSLQQPLYINNVFVSVTNAMGYHASMIDQLVSLTNIMECFYDECFQPKQYIAIAIFSTPCKIFYYETYEANVKESWVINVHHQYAINMTIHKGYVPLTDECQPHYIKFVLSNYSGVHSTFCGHVISETMYSLHATARIDFQAHTSYLYHRNMLRLAYEVTHKGAAHMFSVFYFPQSWEVEISLTPSWTLFRNGRLTYAWYLSNEVTFEERHNETTTSETDAISHLCILNSPAILVQFTSCSNAESAISVYAGLITPSMAVHITDPYSRVACIDGGMYNTTLLFHWYGSVLLQASSMAMGLQLNINFSTTQKPCREDDIPGGDSKSFLSIASYKPHPHILFHSFEYTGQLFNVPSHNMANYTPGIVFQQICECRRLFVIRK